MRRFYLLVLVIATLGPPTSSKAAITFGSHVDGLRTSFFTANSSGTNIRDTAGIAFDPTHTDANGEFDRILLTNHEDSSAKSRRGIHLVDIFNESEAVRIANTGTNNPSGIIVDPLGDIRVSYGANNGTNSPAPSIRNTLNPVTGSEVFYKMITSYGSSNSNDPASIAFVPNGFGGGYDEGEDIIVFDQALHNANNESVVVIDKLSTDSSPMFSTIYSDGTGSSNLNFRGDASNVDGYAYFARLSIKTASLGGTTRPYIERVKGDGLLQRMFLDIPASSMSQSLDNAMKVNPADGSVWLPINDGGDRKFYRVDVANAAAQGGSDFLADISEEITLTGGNAYGVGQNSMAFSPGGKLLAVGVPGGRDAMHVYNVIVPDVSFTASVNTTTGEIIIRNNTNQTIDFAGYTIQSPMNALDANEWTSLSSQSSMSHPIVNPVDGSDPDLIAGSSPGESWTESIGSGNSAIGELFLDGSTTLAPGESISLGKSYNTAITDGNLSFEFLRSSPEFVTQGAVEFTTTLTGDYNGDNVVNLADYTVWRDNLGSSTSLPNESETVTPGAVTAEDYAVWKSNFGLSVPGAASFSHTAIPEPATTTLLFLGCACLLSTRRWQCSVARASCCVMVCFLVTGTRAHADADPIESEDSWTLAILPDTQHYVDNPSNLINFTAQTQWIKDHADSHNISFVLHVGDVVEDYDGGTTDQWGQARTAMDTLHDTDPALAVPYAISLGNHDIGSNGVSSLTRDTEFSDSDKFGFGSPYSNQPSFGGSYDPAKTDNTYHEFSAGGQDWLVLSLEFGPRADVVSWANDIVEDHPNHQVMLLTHAYTDRNDTRLDWATSQNTFNPHNSARYGIANLAGGVNDGQELWDDLVSQHDNFKYVFSGHIEGVGQVTSLGENGSVVHQMLANYQHLDGGGNGYMRLLEFKPDGSVQVRTYSPSLDLHNRAFNEEFLLTPLNGIAGDLNQDFLIDASDWGAFQNGSLTSLGDMTILDRYALGDLDLDGDNDLNDFLLFRRFYDNANGTGALAALQSQGIQEIPEPASIAIFAACGILLLGRRAY